MFFLKLNFVVNSVFLTIRWQKRAQLGTFGRFRLLHFLLFCGKRTKLSDDEDDHLDEQSFGFLLKEKSEILN